MRLLLQLRSTPPADVPQCFIRNGGTTQFRTTAPFLQSQLRKSRFSAAEAPTLLRVKDCARSQACGGAHPHHLALRAGASPEMGGKGQQLLCPSRIPQRCRNSAAGGCEQKFAARTHVDRTSQLASARQEGGILLSAGYSRREGVMDVALSRGRGPSSYVQCTLATATRRDIYCCSPPTEAQ